MNQNTKDWGSVIFSVIGGLALSAALLIGLQYASTDVDHNPENTVTTSGGLTVKLGKVSAELAQTYISVGSGTNIAVPITNTGKEVANLMAQAGVKDTDIVTGNLTVCLSTVIGYKTELNGFVSTKIMKECRNFVPGIMAGTVNTFAEDYTIQSVNEYKTNHTFINKGSK